jgi:Leucine-rich repeat (LRR) protein
MSLTKQEADAASTKVQAMARRMFARDVAYAMVAEKWEKIFDPVRARYYYYNVVDDQAIWKRPAPLMWRDLEHVAPTFTDEQAALLVQSAWRRLKFMRVVRRRIAKVFSKVYEEETGTYYYYNAQTGETSWSKPLVLGSQDIDEGRLVGGDGRLLADDRSEVADSELSDASAGEKSDEESVVDGDDSEEDDSRGDSDDASLMPREWPRSRSQRLVDAAEDDPRGATILKLGGLGLPRVTFRALSIETLTELDVSDNRLSRLQKDFGGLFNLEVLDVSGNRLRTFPRELQDLDKLRALRAAKNRIAWFPAHLWQLGALEELDLCENVLVELPMEVGNLALLQETRVWEVGVGLLEELRVLKLRGNKLAKWPNQLDSLKNLETLDLSKNDLAHMAPVRIAQSEEQKTAAVKPGEVAIGAPDPKQCDWAGLASLKKLDISGNRIAAFPADLAKMTALTELDARDNAIAALPKNLAGLRGLVAFPLDGNRLEKLDDALKGLRALKLLSAPRCVQIKSSTRLQCARIRMF